MSTFLLSAGATWVVYLTVCVLIDLVRLIQQETSNTRKPKR